MAENLREQNTEKMGAGNQFVKLIPRFAFTAFLAVVLLAVSACLKTCLGRRGGGKRGSGGTGFKKRDLFVFYCQPES